MGKAEEVGRLPLGVCCHIPADNDGYLDQSSHMDMEHGQHLLYSES